MADNTIELPAQEPVVEPETPYTRGLIRLAYSQRVDGSGVHAGLSANVTPYRVLSDGTVDQSQNVRQINADTSGQMTAAQEALVAAIAAAVRAYLAGE